MVQKMAKTKKTRQLLRLRAQEKTGPYLFLYITYLRPEVIGLLALFSLYLFYKCFISLL